MPSPSPIRHDFQSGKITNAGLIEHLGLFALKSAATMTRPIHYVGYSKAAKLVKTFLPSKRLIQTNLFADTVFEYPYADGYWSRLINNSDVYSADMEDFLMAIRDVDYVFIDCGANYGYFSAIITGDAYGNKPSIAIEADPGTFETLKKTARLNGDRFEARHNAVFSKSGEMVNIYGEKHEARSILDDHGNRADGNVETVALNDLQPWIKKQKKNAIVLKLDVEGVEIDAMKGAEDLLDQNLLVVFEDHASDKTHEISRYFMETLGMRVFRSEKNGCREISSLDDVAKIKTNPRVGYDFIASKSDIWLNKVAGLKY